VTGVQTCALPIYKFESLGLKQIRGKEIQIELFSIDIL
jgi:hypothetical protein